MFSNPLGKGEVESSILSHSTIQPHINKARGANAMRQHIALGCADVLTKVAKNWQSRSAGIL